MKHVDISKEESLRSEYYKMVSERVDCFLQHLEKIKMLEAGCGSATHITFKRPIESVGIDISEEQLTRNTAITERIHGDIQTYPLPREAFDAVICWDVLEHLPKPMMALRNLFGTVRNGGILVLAFPNLISFKGLVTKWTPYLFHKLFYRVVGYHKTPFRTYLCYSIRPHHVKKFAASNGFSVEFSLLSEGFQQKRVRNRYVLFDTLLYLLDRLLQGLTFGKADGFLLDSCVMILKKSAPQSSSDSSLSETRQSRIGSDLAVSIRQTTPG